MRIEFDQHICVGHGRCYALAPEVYGADDRGHCVVLLSGEVPADLVDAARTGCDNCPEDAIRLVE